MEENRHMSGKSELAKKSREIMSRFVIIFWGDKHISALVLLQGSCGQWRRWDVSAPPVGEEKKGKFSREKSENKTLLFAQETVAIVTVSKGFLCVLEDKEVNQKLQKDSRREEKEDLPASKHAILPGLQWQLGGDAWANGPHCTYHTRRFWVEAFLAWGWFCRLVKLS